MTKISWFHYLAWVVGVFLLAQGRLVNLSEFWILSLIIAPSIWLFFDHYRDKMVFLIGTMILVTPLFLVLEWQKTLDLWIKLIYLALTLLSLKDVARGNLKT